MPRCRRRRAAGAVDRRHQGLAPDRRPSRPLDALRRPHDLLRERGRPHLHPLSLSRPGAVGSTDIRVDEPGDVRCEDDEVDYILKSLAWRLSRRSRYGRGIVYRYTGVRPLPASEDEFHRTHHPRPLRRRDRRRVPPVLCLVGGKWTTFRAFGEQAADTRAGRYSGMTADGRNRGPARSAAARLSRQTTPAERSIASSQAASASSPRARPLLPTATAPRRRGRRCLLPRSGRRRPCRRHLLLPRPRCCYLIGNEHASHARRPSAAPHHDGDHRRALLGIVDPWPTILADELGWTRRESRRRGARLPRRILATIMA